MSEKPQISETKLDTKTATAADKKTPEPAPQVTIPNHVAADPIFTKTSPNDLYRRLLPAVLFLLTFVTVMTILLIYMDTVALGAQQFRRNMSRDYELESIPQESPAFIDFVRQLHLKPRGAGGPLPQPLPSRRLEELGKLFYDDYKGKCIEILPSGQTSSAVVSLSQRGWSTLCVRAEPRDYLRLSSKHSALHACLSGTDHPREVSYQPPEAETGAVESSFRSRILCLPLFTMLAAADCIDADYVVLGGNTIVEALDVLPFASVDLKVIDIHTTDPKQRLAVTSILRSNNYTIQAEFDDGIMFKSNTLKIGNATID